MKSMKESKEREGKGKWEKERRRSLASGVSLLYYFIEATTGAFI